MMMLMSMMMMINIIGYHVFNVIELTDEPEKFSEYRFFNHPELNFNPRNPKHAN